MSAKLKLRNVRNFPSTGGVKTVAHGTKRKEENTRNFDESFFCTSI